MVRSGLRNQKNQKEEQEMFKRQTKLFFAKAAVVLIGLIIMTGFGVTVALPEGSIESSRFFMPTALGLMGLLVVGMGLTGYIIINDPNC